MLQRTLLVRLALTIAVFAVLTSSTPAVYAEQVGVGETTTDATATPLATTGETQVPLVSGGVLLVLVGGAVLYLNRQRKAQA